jgi:hypothetical protein
MSCGVSRSLYYCPCKCWAESHAFAWLTELGWKRGDRRCLSLQALPFQVGGIKVGELTPEGSLAEKVGEG